MKEPVVERVMVTPAMADEWLTGNTHNRNLSNAYVLKLARDLRKGNWRLTHQGIAFDEDGTLVDGQHRLWAILEAKIPVEMFVTRNIPMSSQLVIDAHEGRKPHDYLTLTDKYGTVRRVEASMIRRLLKGSGKAWPKLTHTELDEAFQQHIKAIKWALECFPKEGRARITGVVTFVVIARAYYSPFDKDDIARFCEIFYTGTGAKTKRDHTILHLRESLIRGQGNAGRPWVPDLQYAKVEMGLLAYLQGEYKKRATPRHSKELFNLPHERHDHTVIKRPAKAKRDPKLYGNATLAAYKFLQKRKGKIVTVREAANAFVCTGDAARARILRCIDLGWAKRVELPENLRVEGQIYGYKYVGGQG